jgi:hypothetical protein
LGPEKEEAAAEEVAEAETPEMANCPERGK